MKAEPLTVQQALAKARQVLAAASDTPGLDAQTLLAKLSGRPRTWLLAHPETALACPTLGALGEALAWVEQGQPLPYVLGTWEFYGLEFRVTPAVLIPRPETELLVETALGWLLQNPGRRKGMDAGTGSGCIAISLAAHIPDLHMTAADISAEALKVAEENFRRHDLQKRIHLVRGDLLQPFLERFDLICANLPYIPTHTLQNLAVSRYEPSLALDGGPDGLDLIRRLLEQACSRLAPGGLLLAEIEAGQGAAVFALASEFFPGAAIRVRQDLAGRDRLLTVESRAGDFKK